MSNETERQAKIQSFLRDLGNGVNQLIKDDIGEMGFAVLLFDFGQPGIGNYISNADRECMIQALRETADRLENNQDGTRTCRVCGCTDDDCSGCIERTGVPCYWVENDLCSACNEKPATDYKGDPIPQKYIVDPGDYR